MSVRVTSGIDIVEIQRIEQVVERWGSRFLQRIFTDAEIDYCAGRPQSIAGRFAAKEAVSKALGVGIQTFSWKDIEVSRGPHGKPIVTLHRNALRLAGDLGLTAVDISISHSARDAVAVAVAWGETP